MAFTIRKPLTIELPRPQQDAADERKRARLAEETEKFLEEAARRASEKAQQQVPDDFMDRAIARAKEIAAERGPAPEPQAPEDGGGFLGGLRDVGRGALDVGRDVVGAIDRGLEAVAPAAREAAEAGFRGLPVGQVAEAVRAIPGVPKTGGGPTITDFARRPFVPGAEQIGQAAEFTVREPLAAAQAEVEFGRPITEPVGRALGRAAVAALPAGQVVDVATQGRLSDIAEEIGGVVAPELVVLSNAVPVEAPLFAGAKLLFRGVRVPVRALEALARVAKGGATIEVLEAGVKTDLAKFADEAARAVELRPVVEPSRLTPGQGKDYVSQLLDDPVVRVPVSGGSVSGGGGIGPPMTLKQRTIALEQMQPTQVTEAVWDDTVRAARDNWIRRGFFDEAGKPVLDATAAPSRLTPGQEAVPPVERAVPDEAARTLTPEEAELKRLGVQPMGGGNPVQRLREAIEQSKKLTKEQQALRTKEVARRAAAVGEELRGDLPPGERLARARARQTGELPSLGLEPLTNQLDEATILDLHGMIDATFRPFKRRDFDYANAMEAFRNLIYDGKLPRPFEQGLLQEVFGPEVMIALQKKRGVSLLAELQALINVPRVLLTVFDHSMVLRQDAITALNPRWAKETKQSFTQSIKALKRVNAEEIELLMRQTPEYVLAKEHNVDFAVLRGGTFTAVEEPFIGAAEMTYVGRFIRKWVPGINISEQIATVYLNQKRMKLYSRLANELEQSGVNVTDDLLDEVGEMVNVLTGRATLPKGLDPFVPVLNAVFFSAKMNLSRVKTPVIIARAVLGGEKRTVGLLMAREFATYIATGMTILGALKASGLAKVETDCRSTDFGKAKVGNTRLDFWGGFQPIVRFACQAAMRERKTALGEVVPANIKELTWRFARSKFSPQFGTAVNIAEGENIIGEPITTEAGDLKRMAFETFTPLFIQDVVDAVREMGLLGIPMAAPGVLGVNVQSYTNPSVQKAQAIQQAITEGVVQGEYRVDGEPYVPVRFGELDADDQNRVAERFPEFFSEEAFAERPAATEGIPEFQQRAIRGETIGGAQEKKAQRLSEIAIQSGAGDRSDQQLRRNLTESIKDSLSDYGAVLEQSFEQFQFEGDEETFSRQQELATRYRRLSEEHNARFTMADPELRDAAWARFEETVAQEFTDADLATLDRARVANDSDVERAWHELNSQLGDYYDTPEGEQRERLRQRNPKVDGILWALGRVSRVMSATAQGEAVKAFGQLYGTTISSADVTRSGGFVPSFGERIAPSRERVPSFSERIGR